MEENGDDYIHQTGSFVNTMNTRVNRSIVKPPKNIKTLDLYQLLYKNSIFEYKKPQLKLETKFGSPSTIYVLRKVTSLNSHVKNFNLLKLQL